MNMLDRLLLLDEKGRQTLRRSVIACVFTSLSLMIPFSLTILIFSELLKPFTGQEVSWVSLWIYFGMGLVSFVLTFLLSRNDYMKTYGTSYGQAEATRLSVAEHMRKLPMSFFNTKDLSELSSNIVADCTNIEQTLSSVIPQLIANIIASTIVCALLAFFDWRLALALFITLPLAVVVFWFSRKIQERAFGRHVDASRMAGKQAQEYLEGIKVIRACGLSGPRFKALDDAFLEQRKEAIKVELIAGSVMGVASMILRSGLGIVTFVGVIMLTQGMVDFLTLLVFLLIATRVYGPLLTVLTLLPDMLYLQVSSKRLRALMDALPMDGDADIVKADNTIKFDNVSFAYRDVKVLDAVSLVIPEGKISALVGPSGSGKSTVSRLAARFWDAQEGKVTLGGIDVTKVDPEELMKRFSFVFQDVTLFNDTVENNIRIGRSDASDAEVRAAAEAACCTEFVGRMAQGYQTLLGENGATLSGGERQRISIARALLKDAPIVLLDEATASLDPENEVLVQHAIGRLIQNKTVLVIAHRLRTIAAADNIIVLERGSVAEQGSHQDLLEQGGLYKTLYDIQQNNAQWGQKEL